MITRRNFLVGLIAAPAIIRTPGLLMPVKDRTIYRIGAWPLRVMEHGVSTTYTAEMILRSTPDDHREWVLSPDGQRLLLAPQGQFWSHGDVKWISQIL